MSRRRPSILQRLLAALRGGGRPPQVLVLVSTTRGQRAVPMDLRDLER